MRRIAQLGILLFLLVMLLAPVAEFFDSWDPAGLSNDTEFGVFALAFAVCLALAVCLLVAGRCFRNQLAPGTALRSPAEARLLLALEAVVCVFIPPRSTPLRI